MLHPGDSRTEYPFVVVCDRCSDARGVDHLEDIPKGWKHPITLGEFAPWISVLDLHVCPECPDEEFVGMV